MSFWGWRSRSAVPLRPCWSARTASRFTFAQWVTTASRALGTVGIQYVIWTAADEQDLRRCERFLKHAKAHVHTRTGDGFTLVEGSDPNGVPVMVAYPGPDLAVRRGIMKRIYAW